MFDPPHDPDTPEEWQYVVNAAEMYRLVDSARQYGLITGGPVANLERCDELLARGAAQGVRPVEADVDALIAVWVRDRG